MKRKRMKCRLCPSNFRTRRPDLASKGVCPACDKLCYEESEGGVEGYLDWTMTKESWLHQLIYLNAERGLRVLGLGELSFIDSSQRTMERMGKWTHKGCIGTNEYDLLMKTEDKRLVCIEAKRKADLATANQILRYYVDLKKLSESKGREPPVMVVMANRFTPAFMGAVRAFDFEVKLFKISLSYSAFGIKEVKGE